MTEGSGHDAFLRRSDEIFQRLAEYEVAPAGTEPSEALRADFDWLAGQIEARSPLSAEGRVQIRLLQGRVGVHLVLSGRDEAGTLTGLTAEALSIAANEARDAALEGSSSARESLATCLAFLTGLALGDPGEKILRSIDDTVERLLTYVRPDSAASVSTAAQLASGWGRAATAARSHGDVPSTELPTALERNRRWVDLAVRWLDDLDAPSRGTAPLSVAVAIGNSALAEANPASDPLEDLPLRMARLAGLWMHLTQLVGATHGDDDAVSPPRAQLLFAIQALLNAALVAAGEMPIDVSGPVLRLSFHQLPLALWPRDRSGRDVLELYQASPSEPLEELRQFLDRVEVGLLHAELLHTVREFERSDADGAYDVQGEEEIGLSETGMALLLLQMMMVEPPASRGHLAMALYLMGDGESYGIDAVEDMVPDRASLTDQDSSPVIMSGNWRVEDLEALRLVNQIQRALLFRPLADLVPQAQRIFFEALEPIVERDPDRGARWTWQLMWGLGELGTAGSVALESALDLVDQISYALAQAGAGGPVLGSVRQQILFALAQTNRTRFHDLERDADDYIVFIDGSSPDPTTAPQFGTAGLIRALRFQALAVLGTREILDDVALEKVDLAHRRLLQMSHAQLEADDAEKALGYASEIEVLRAHRVTGPAESPAPDWSALFRIRPIDYLSSLLKRREPVSSPEELALVNEAFELMMTLTIESAARMGTQGDFLARFTHPDSGAHLGLSAEQRLRLAEVAADVLVRADPEAARIAVIVGANAGDLLWARGFEHRAGVLLERIAERFLPMALTAGDPSPPLVWLLMNRASAALNMGAVCEEEWAHRLSVAIAAHLLAVRVDDADAAAWSAYYVAEIARLRHAPHAALRWYVVHDEWRRVGGMSDPQYEVQLAGIEYDRRQLLRDLKADDGR